MQNLITATVGCICALQGAPHGRHWMTMCSRSVATLELLSPALLLGHSDVPRVDPLAPESERAAPPMVLTVES